MADNIIKRIIQLILDKESAKKVDDEAKSLAESVENSWKKAAERIAEYLGIAFLTEKMVEFGKEAIEHASEAEMAWAQLQSVIENTGESFDGMREHLVEASRAFQDATIHEDEEYVKSLTRMIALTGDVSASTNNMGLVANVAARFYKGELEPAVTLVAKAMNGNVIGLQRLGIHAKDAQDALNILAQRSMGAANREAESFTGQLKQMHNAWNDVLESLGDAIITSGGADNALGVLRSTIQSLNTWINKNKEEISGWVTNGVAFAIDATDVLIRSVMVVSDTFRGVFALSAGIAVRAVGEVAYAYATAEVAIKSYAVMLGTKSAAELADALVLQKNADEIRTWGKAAIAVSDDLNERIKKNLTTPLFSSDMFKTPPKPKELEVGTPTPGKNMTSDSIKEVEKAIEEFDKATLAAQNMKAILGDQFDAVGAEIDRTTKLLNVLAGNGIDPATTRFGDLQGRLRELVTVMKPTNDIQKELAKGLQSDLAVGLVTASTGMKNATTSLDSLKARQGEYLSELKKMAGTQMEGSALWKQYVEEYNAYAAAIADQTKVQAMIDINKELNKTISVDHAMAVETGVSSLDQLKAQQQALAQAMRKALLEDIDPLSDGYQNLARQLDEVNDAVKDAESMEKVTGILRQFGDTMRADLFTATVNGTTGLERLKNEQKNLETAMKSLNPNIEREAKELEKLKERYKEVTAAIKEQTVAMQFQATIADLLADILGTAMQGGIAQAAAVKAKQNAIEAAEMLVRAGVFALFGNLPAASAALVAAGQFAVLATAWGALSAASGGGGSAAPPVSGAGSLGSGGADLSSSSAASSGATDKAQPVGPQVDIYLVGPGFNALNPHVQEVVWGASQQAKERYGENARIRIRSNGGN